MRRRNTALANKDEGPTALTAAVLEGHLQKERVDRKHERFYLSFVIIVLACVILTKYLDGGWTGAVLIFALGILLSYGLAQHWEVTPVVRPLEQMWNAILSHFRKGGGKDETKEG